MINSRNFLPQQSIVHPDFEQPSVYNHELSIELDCNGFAYCIFNGETNTFEVLKAYAFEKSIAEYQFIEVIKYFKEQEEWLKDASRFRKVNFHFFSDKYILIPQEVYQNGKGTDYFDLNFKRERNEHLFRDSMKDLEAENIYSLPIGLKNALQLIYPSSDVKHGFSSLIQTLLLQNEIGFSAYLHFRKNILDLFFIQDQKLILSNQFNFKAKEDVLYYFLNTAEQLGFNKDENFVYLLGQGINFADEQHENIYKYIRHVDFIKPQFDFSETIFEKLPTHHYYSLMALAQCE